MTARDPLLRAARAAVEPLGEQLDLSPYESLRWRRDRPHRPVLALDDVSGIPFLSDISGVAEYQHRARLRARDGDLFAATTPQTAGYGDYCRVTLDLGRAEFVLAAPSGPAIEVAAACRHAPAFGAIVARARAADGLVIHPYMGIEAVWDLADSLAVASRREVTVLAPPPPVTWIANDKSTFSELVRLTLGPEWLVETREAASADALARALRDLATRHERVALKRRRCASAMGNAVFERSALEQLGAAGTLAEVRAFLARTEWDGEESVQAVAWEPCALSPSTQVWIPPLDGADPVLEGIYEQILEQRRGVFVGSRPSRLPAPVHAGLERGSLAAAAGLQALGYVGRCSFDFLVVGDPEADFQLRFTECNGRWGGTSTPMSLVDRLVDGPRPPYRAQDFVSPQLAGASFSDVLGAVGDDLYSPAAGGGRFVFYNVGPLAEFGKLDVISLGRTQDEAEEGMLERLPRLLGIGPAAAW